MRVRLIEIQGDQIEFADLIGECGELHLHSNKSSELNRFCPDDRGDWLSFSVKEATPKDGKISISTRLGNTFLFQEIKNESSL